MKQFIVILFLISTALLIGDTVLHEDFESGVIPATWTHEFVQGNEFWTVSNGGYSGHPESANSGFFNARFFVDDTAGNTTKLVTPQFNLGINEVGILSFYHAQQEWVGYQDELKIYYKNSADGDWTLLVSLPVNTPNWTLRQITLPNPSTTYWVAFEGYSEYGYGVCIDDVNVDGQPMYNSDLQGIALTGPSNVTAGTSVSYAVNVLNAGIEAQSNYNLNLYKEGGIEIATILVTDEIAPGSSENHYVIWNISDTEPESYLNIYAEVDLASDENVYNNITPEIVVHVSPPGTQYLVEEGFEGGVIPDGWTQEYESGTEDWIVQTGGQSSNPPTAHNGENNAAFIHSANGNKTKLLTPEMNLGTANPGTLTFWHTQALWVSDQDELRIFYKNAPAGDWILLETYTDNITEWTERTITLPYPSPNYQVAFEATDYYGYGVCLDDVVIIGNPTVFDNDLAATGIDGATITNAGNTEVYEIQVKNVGDLPQSSYTVKLMKTGDVELNSQAITQTLQPGEIAIHNLVWNLPANEPDGLAYIWAEVDLTGDENEFNNVTSNIVVQVFPQGILEVVVGDGIEANNRLPVCFQYLNSLTESIYFPNELNNLTGHINALTYYNNFSSNIYNKPIKIWMGETDSTSLINSWIPASELSLVFDGAVSFQEGENAITINLDSQYYYSGRNLVVMVHRPMDTDSYGTTDNFYLTETALIMDRTRYERDDTIILDPYNPVDGYTFEKFPNTKFTFFQGEMGDVQGYVKDDDGNAIENAQIKILENEQIVYSDETGFFHIGNVLVGTYQFEASSFGYNSQIIVDDVSSSDILLLDFELAPLGAANVTGFAVGSDSPETGLIGATVTLSGFDDYETTTDGEGNFVIPDVYVNQNYNAVIDHEDYESTSMDIYVTPGGLDMGQVILNEFTTPPTNVVGIQNAEGTIVDVSWNSPGIGGNEFRYDDGDAVFQVGFSQIYPNSSFGVVFLNNASINEVKWQLSNEYGAHSQVKILILGLSNENLPDSDNLLYLSDMIPNNDNRWNTYVLSETINAPNGFYVGVITPNLYTGVALDDGLDAPWEYIPGRQLATTDWTNATEPWQEIGDFGLSQNMLIRAYGFNYGGRTRPEIISNKETIESFSDRFFESFRVYRFVDIYQNQPDHWTEVAASVADTTYSDMSWSSLDPGFYKYAVSAVHTNDVESLPSFSDVIQKTTPAGLDDEEVPLYTNGLVSNIPNPFNPETELFFIVADDNKLVNISIYNTKGQKIRGLIDEPFTQGLHSVIWDGLDDAGISVGSGVYFYNMKVGNNNIETKKMMLIK